MRDLSKHQAEVLASELLKSRKMTTVELPYGQGVARIPLDTPEIVERVQRTTPVDPPGLPSGWTDSGYLGDGIQYEIRTYGCDSNRTMKVTISLLRTVDVTPVTVLRSENRIVVAGLYKIDLPRSVEYHRDTYIGTVSPDGRTVTVQVTFKNPSRNYSNYVRLV